MMVNTDLIVQMKVKKEEEKHEDQSFEVFKLRHDIEKHKEISETLLRECATKRMKNLKTINLKKSQLSAEIKASSLVARNSAMQSIANEDSGCHVDEECYMKEEDHSDEELSYAKEKLELHVVKLLEEKKRMKKQIEELQSYCQCLQLEKIANSVSRNAMFEGIEESLQEENAKRTQQCFALQQSLEESRTEAVLLKNRIQLLKEEMENQMNENEITVKKLEMKNREELENLRESLMTLEEKKPTIVDELRNMFADKKSFYHKKIDEMKEGLEMIHTSNESYRKENVRLLGKMSVLEDGSKQLKDDLKNEIELREEMMAEKEECAKCVANLTVEKACLLERNKQLMMKKNKLRLKIEQFKMRCEDQESILQKAQSNLRELEEENYARRLSRRKGMTNLICWK